MCRFLRVPRSGSYAWQQRPPSAREKENRRLSKEIRVIHHEVNGIYGHRRIKAELTAIGLVCGFPHQGLPCSCVRFDDCGHLHAALKACRCTGTVLNLYIGTIGLL
ncbi:IS3 family transposase [Pseudomonas mangiferae]|uniref:IS3 family transposase n=1 Tax=Pseudomonas mangiferae TaxID=2593654 RepID=UPI0038998FFB